MNKFFIAISVILLALCDSIEAKSIECVFNKTVHTNCVVDSTLQNCQTITIENIGHQPLLNCFPHTQDMPAFTIDALAYQLAAKSHPLLALYNLWYQTVVSTSSSDHADQMTLVNNMHPLDILNFRGTCTQYDYDNQFLKLCHALGIKTRIANMYNKTGYDFCLDEDAWVFLNLQTGQYYLSLDNKTPISSEEIMDDPFLALRSNHEWQSNHIDFSKGWSELAHFEIIEPSAALPFTSTLDPLPLRPIGFDLYPGERLTFENADICPKLADYEYQINHFVNLNVRTISSSLEYYSPIPIHKIENRSDVIVNFPSLNIHIQPNQQHIFANGDMLFQLICEFSTTPTFGELVFSVICSNALFPALITGQNDLYLGTEENPTIVRLACIFDEKLDTAHCDIQITNQDPIFDYCSPIFSLSTTNAQVPDLILWQISADRDFGIVSSNLEQVTSYSPLISLSLIDQTFLNANEPYYFRVKGCYNGVWHNWSHSYSFMIQKPQTIEHVEFDQLKNGKYVLDWERWAEDDAESLEYLIFGSNALDFIPSIYCDMQINAMVDGKVCEEEKNNNLIAITKQPKLVIKGRPFAYYRIVTRKHGQLSVPSEIICFYAEEHFNVRTVLQVVQDHSHIKSIKRVLFANVYPSSHILPAPMQDALHGDSLIKIKHLLRAHNVQTTVYDYQLPNVSEEIWNEVRPHLLPENHPVWPKLCRVFCKTRVTRNHDTFRDAGFKRWRPGKWSRVSASSHPQFNEYFIKAYCDCELGILYDWKRWIHRIEGAKATLECIKKYNLKKYLTVPKKWIFPLPAHPSSVDNERYKRKNFILVCENVRALDHAKNEKKYGRMNRTQLEALYIVLQGVGLCDSVYPFNIPFCKDGRMAVIDTEYWGKWPVPFHRLTRYFASDMREFWKKLTYKEGNIPRGAAQYNPPRNDRRDRKL